MKIIREGFEIKKPQEGRFTTKYVLCSAQQINEKDKIGSLFDYISKSEYIIFIVMKPIEKNRLEELLQKIKY